MSPSDWSNTIVAAIAVGGVIWAVLKGFLTLAAKVENLTKEVSKIDKTLDTRLGPIEMSLSGHDARLLKLEIVTGIVELHIAHPKESHPKP